MPTATARFSSTTGERRDCAQAHRKSATIRGQSVSLAVRARAWQAAIAACRRVRPAGAAERLRPRERGEPAPDQQLVPARAVLIEQQDRLARGSDPGGRARCLDLHQRHEAVHLGLGRRKLGQDAAEPQRVLAQSGPHPVVAGGRGVALVEDEIDDLEHGREPCGQLLPAGHLEGHMRFGERALGAHDALRNRRLRDQERRRDLGGGEPAEQLSVSATRASVREHRVAGGEDEPQQVVADLIVGVARPARARPPRAAARSRA